MKNNVMLISVGGSPEPIIHVIKTKQPKKIVFFSSESSRSQVEERILPAVGYFPQCGHIVTPDPEDVGKSTFELLEKMPEELRKLKETIAWPQLCGYTGGTKAMSAAVVWASSRFPCELLYVGGRKRSKAGLGVVETGHEILVAIENPWNRLGWFEVRTAFELFNRGQYGNATELVRNVKKRVSDTEMKRLLEWLNNAFEAFFAWDIFNHKQAGKLHAVVEDAGFILALPEKSLPGLHDFCRQTKACLPFLKKIKPGKLSRAMALDLLANARRRAELEGKYEDAVARCYSAVEKLAKVRLRDSYSINNSQARLEQIPESLREEFQHYTQEDGWLEFGFKASFRLLAELGDEMGRRYMQKENANGELLGRRNNSILGHGFSPVGKEEYESFFKLALELAGIQADELVRFPVFPKSSDVSDVR